MHNKEYALNLVQDKINGNHNYSYSQIASLTGYAKVQIYRLSVQLNRLIETKQIEGYRQDPIKKEQLRIDNQKQLEQVLRDRDERLKARTKL